MSYLVPDPSSSKETLPAKISSIATVTGLSDFVSTSGLAPFTNCRALFAVATTKEYLLLVLSEKASSGGCNIAH